MMFDHFAMHLVVSVLKCNQFCTNVRAPESAQTWIHFCRSYLKYNRSPEQNLNVDNNLGVHNGWIAAFRLHNTRIYNVHLEK